MDRRTKILAGVLGLAVLFGIFSQVIYPDYIRPWLTLDERIAREEETLAKLQELEARVQKAKYEYREYLVRSGTQNITHATSDVRERINKLIEQHKLADAKVTPSRPAKDRKTGLESVVVTVSAGGNLESAVNFLRDLSELPHLLRLGSVALVPAASSSRRGMVQDQLNIRVPVEIWTLPDQRIVGRIAPEDLTRTEDLYVRHQGRDYQKIWSGAPFSDYVPLVASTVPAITVQKGQSRVLEVNATGGRGNYTYLWSPAEGLSDPSAPNPKMSAAEAGVRRYDVTVTDASGKTASANVMVTISDPPPPTDTVVTKEPNKKPPVDTGPKPWADGQYKELRMALLRTQGSERLDEFMLYDTRNRQNSYYKVGDEFDGGTLVYVHQTGGVARRKDEYYVYPLGLTVQQAVRADAAEAYPELQKAADYHKNAMAEATKAAAVKSPDDGVSGAPKSPGSRRAAGSKPAATPGEQPVVVTDEGNAGETGPPALGPAITAPLDVPGDDAKTNPVKPGPAAEGAKPETDGTQPAEKPKPARPRPARRQPPK